MGPFDIYISKYFMEAARDDEEGQKKVEEFLKKYGCDATFEDVKAFLEGKNEEELDEDELEAVAGGKIDWDSLARKVIKQGEVL